MQQTPLGVHGPLVSKLGFGCGPGAGLMIGDDYAAQHSAVSLAAAGGVTFFDTAAAYGDGRSETNLGRALRGVDIKPVVCSKVPLAADDLRAIRGAVYRNVAATLDRLEHESLGALFLHNRVGGRPTGTTSDGVGPRISMPDLLGPGGVAETLAELRAEGVVQAIGFTTLSVDPPVAIEIARSGVFDALNWAPGETGAEEVIEQARAADLAVIAIRVLGGHVPDNVDVAVRIRACLADDRVTSTVIGFSTAAHVQQAIAAVS